MRFIRQLAKRQHVIATKAACGLPSLAVLVAAGERDVVMFARRVFVLPDGRLESADADFVNWLFFRCVFHFSLRSVLERFVFTRSQTNAPKTVSTDASERGVQGGGALADEMTKPWREAARSNWNKALEAEMKLKNQREERRRIKAVWKNTAPAMVT